MYELKFNKNTLKKKKKKKNFTHYLWTTPAFPRLATQPDNRVPGIIIFKEFSGKQNLI